jgi:hypothetical protein
VFSSDKDEIGKGRELTAEKTNSEKVEFSTSGTTGRREKAPAYRSALWRSNGKAEAE